MKGKLTDLRTRLQQRSQAKRDTMFGPGAAGEVPGVVNHGFNDDKCYLTFNMPLQCLAMTMEQYEATIQAMQNCLAECKAALAKRSS